MKNTIQVNGKRMVCRIYDKPEFCDRYTIAFKGYHVDGYGMVYPYLASSEHPFHPQGFGQHGEAKHFIDGRLIGKRITFDTLPADVQKFVLQQFEASK